MVFEYHNVKESAVGTKKGLLKAGGDMFREGKLELISMLFSPLLSDSIRKCVPWSEGRKIHNAKIKGVKLAVVAIVEH